VSTSYDKATRMVAVAVADTGIGIPADHHQKVFEDFRQVDSSTTRAYGGTGLGLSICRRLATILYSSAEALRVLAVLLNPAMPKASSRLWESLGAAEALGALAEQPLADAGRWGQLVPGARVSKGDALFPRLDA
jgi:hypothetical protein